MDVTNAEGKLGIFIFWTVKLDLPSKNFIDLQLTNLCPLRRKNRSFAAMDVMSLEEPLSRSKRTQVRFTKSFYHWFYFIIQDTQLYPSLAACTGDTQTIATQCSYSNWMSIGISWRLTDVAVDIKKALCSAVDTELNK